LSKTLAKEFATRVHRFARLIDVPAGEAYSSYFLDAKTPDIDLWPLPILAARVPADDFKKAVSVYLMKVSGETSIEPVSADKALRFGVKSSLDDLTTFMAQVADPLSGRKIMAVHHLDLSGDVFLVQMMNGSSYLLPKTVLDEADSSPVTSCQASDDDEYFSVSQASGNAFDVPWDDVLYHCEPAYEYYKGRSPHSREESEERPIRIGGRISQLRREKGVSVAELARQAKMLRPNLSRLEAGKHLPSLETLERIADALEVPVAQLITKS